MVSIGRRASSKASSTIAASLEIEEKSCNLKLHVQHQNAIKSSHSDMLQNHIAINNNNQLANPLTSIDNNDQEQVHNQHKSSSKANMDSRMKQQQQHKSKISKSSSSHDSTYQYDDLNICAGCTNPIKDQFLLEAIDKRWHEDCLKCACCDCRLGEVGSSLFIHLDKIFCRRDFLRIFGQRGECGVCNKTIEPYELVMKAKGYAYHIECFSCQRCQARFCVGDQFCLWSPSKIICIQCHQLAADSGCNPLVNDQLDSLLENTHTTSSSTHQMSIA